jgi:hypothetical protein
MDTHVLESLYPLYFRKEDAAKLARHIKNRHSLVLIGMKRVGISNFLRFFLYNPAVVKTYIQDEKKYLFILVDLNDLIEREVIPFWVLTFKRIVDSINQSDVDEDTKKQIENLFLESIQLNDQFMLIENIRKSLLKVIDRDYLPTLFYLRFDRLQDVASEDLLANLRGLKDSTHQILNLVFTCFKPLPEVMPKAVNKALLASFTQDMYLKPTLEEDQRVLLDTHQVRYDLSLTQKQHSQLVKYSGGHMRYLQLSLIVFNELNDSKRDMDLLEILRNDERLVLQSEELWESLNKSEQGILKKLITKTPLDGEDLDSGRYLFETGFISEVKGNYEIFSPLLEEFIKSRPHGVSFSESAQEFTKKELSLFTFLKNNINEVCERESIIEAVWSDEEEALEVSDWAMDRLVARVRSKLKKQASEFEIVTVRTRGYKLINS